MPIWLPTMEIFIYPCFYFFFNWVEMEKSIVCFSSSVHTVKEYIKKIELSFDNVLSFETKEKTYLWELIKKLI